MEVIESVTICIHYGDCVIKLICGVRKKAGFSDMMRALPFCVYVSDELKFVLS